MNRVRLEETPKHKQTGVWVILVLFSALMVSCARSETGSGTEEAVGQESAPSSVIVGSCDVRTSLNYCYEYVGAEWTEQGAQDECASAPGGKRSGSRCPRPDVVGSCQYHPGGNQSRELIYYYYPPLDTSTAEKSCPGTFVANPCVNTRTMRSSPL